MAFVFQQLTEEIKVGWDEGLFGFDLTERVVENHLQMAHDVNDGHGGRSRNAGQAMKLYQTFSLADFV